MQLHYFYTEFSYLGSIHRNDSSCFPDFLSKYRYIHFAVIDKFNTGNIRTECVICRKYSEREW